MINLDWKGGLDILSGVIIAVSSIQIPKALTLLVAGFLIARGLDKVLEPVNIPDMTFLIDGGADIIAALIIFFSTAPIYPELANSYAGIIMLKGGWTYVQEM